MDASVILWEQWQQQVKQLFDGLHGHQKKASHSTGLSARFTYTQCVAASVVFLAVGSAGW